MSYRDILDGDHRYVSARQTNQSERGWAFDPPAPRRPSLYGSALRGLAVFLIATAAAWAFGLAVMP